MRVYARSLAATSVDLLTGLYITGREYAARRRTT
jgi:hypothetical protein